LSGSGQVGLNGTRLNSQIDTLLPLRMTPPVQEVTMK
jgi:hypothetical protein